MLNSKLAPFLFILERTIFITFIIIWIDFYSPGTDLLSPLTANSVENSVLTMLQEGNQCSVLTFYSKFNQILSYSPQVLVKILKLMSFSLINSCLPFSYLIHIFQKNTALNVLQFIFILIYISLTLLKYKLRYNKHFEFT